MAKINDNYLKLTSGYLFPEIARRVQVFSAKDKKANLIRLGIGDVVLPLPAVVIEAMHKGVDEMGKIPYEVSIQKHWKSSYH